MSGEKLIRRDVILGKPTTNVGLRQTGPNLVPVSGVGDVVPEPWREAVEPILPVPSAWDGVPAVRARDHEGEDKDNEEEDNEDGHAEKVQGEEALAVPVGADESGQGDEEDERAEDDHRPPEVVGTLVVGLRGQPDARRNYGDGGQEGYKVENCRDVVAHSHGFRETQPGLEIRRENSSKNYGSEVDEWELRVRDEDLVLVLVLVMVGAVGGFCIRSVSVKVWASSLSMKSVGVFWEKWLERSIVWWSLRWRLMGRSTEETSVQISSIIRCIGGKDGSPHLIPLTEGKDDKQQCFSFDFQSKYSYFRKQAAMSLLGTKILKRAVLTKIKICPLSNILKPFFGLYR